jgi:hypothetical protein
MGASSVSRAYRLNIRRGTGRSGGPGRSAAAARLAVVVMVRILSLLGSGCFLAAVLLLSTGRGLGLAIVLLLMSAGLGAFLLVRRGFLLARDVATQAHAFISGDIQHARLVEVGEPHGIFNPQANLVLELEGEDGATHRFDRDVPIPFAMAWSYRLGKRFRAPWIGNADLTGMMAFELRREGLDVDLSRPEAESSEGVTG